MGQMTSLSSCSPISKGVSAHHPLFTDKQPVSDVTQVRAGWLECQPKQGAFVPEDPDRSEWVIRPAQPWKDKGREWLEISIEGTLLAAVNKRPEAREEWLRKDLMAKYRQSQQTKQNQDVIDFETEKQIDGRSGVLVFSGEAPKATIPPPPKKDCTKKKEYLFNGASGKPHTLHRDDVETFQRLYSKPSKNAPVPDGSYKTLLPTLKAGKRIPVFYVGDLPTDGERAATGFAFGLTRLFKRPHNLRVQDVLKMSRPAHIISQDEDFQPDFVENLFGYVHEKDTHRHAEDRVAPVEAARRGRVAFSMATLVPGQEPETRALKALLLGPRASFAPFYLASLVGDCPLDYSASAPPVTLAGRKRYLPRYHGLHNICSPREFHLKIKKEMEKWHSEADEKIVSDLRF